MKKLQQGMSFYAICIVLVIAVFFGMIFAKVGPIFLDNATLTGSVTKILESDLEGVGKGALSERISRAMTIDNVSSEASRALVIQKQDGRFVVTAEYEVRVNMFYNIDVVVSFDEEYRQP